MVATLVVNTVYHTALIRLAVVCQQRRVIAVRYAHIVARLINEEGY